MRKSVLAVVAAISMISVSSGAAAQSAAPLSIAAPLSVAAHSRAGADLQQPNDIRGGFILPTLAVLAIIGLIYVLTKDNSPSSP